MESGISKLFSLEVYWLWSGCVRSRIVPGLLLFVQSQWKQCLLLLSSGWAIIAEVMLMTLNFSRALSCILLL